MPVTEQTTQWLLRYYSHPWSLNDERSWHFHQRARVVKQWIKAYRELVAECDPPIPRCEQIACVATPIGVGQDVLNCAPAVKAAIDGLTDDDKHGHVGIIRDDTPKHVVRVTCMPPRRKLTHEATGLELVVIRLA